MLNTFSASSLHLEDEAALVAEHDRALDRQAPARAADRLGGLLLDLGVGRDEHHADAAGGRDGELL